MANANGSVDFENNWWSLHPTHLRITELARYNEVIRKINRMIVKYKFWKGN